jgi:hypothetical protein
MPGILPSPPLFFNGSALIDVSLNGNVREALGD